MILKLYSVFDRITGLYEPPVAVYNEDMAIRNFNYSMSKSPMVQGDCELYYLGQYDTEHGILYPEASPVFVTRYSEVKDNG